MGIVNKYKVNELAKDFGMQTREIIDILGKYFDTPKKSGQNLDEKELEEAEKPLSVTFTFTREKIWTMDSATETVKVNVIPAMEIAGEDLKAETSYSPSGQKITDIFPELGEYATDYTVFKYS